MQIAGKTFLVTGGGSGLGAATVRRLAKAGGNVLIVDLNEENGKAVAAELGKQGRFVAADVSNEAAVQKAVAAAKETFGGLHGAINCAGIGTAMRVLAKDGPHNLEVFTHVIKVNLIGTFNVIRLASQLMAAGEPDEFAMLAVQIVENPMLNGETIRLDGAIRMAPK